MLWHTAAKKAILFILSLVTGLALAGFTPLSAQADEPPVDLELGDEGAITWDIVNIQPGNSGTKTVSLHNAGYKDGFVFIWISDIVSSEGTNPESESGDTAEPGELVNYLVFNLSCSELSTNIGLPATIGDLPQSSSDSHYIEVSPLNAGETITLIWEWAFPETGEPQNDAQGDGLSFTINYALEEFSRGGGGGGGGGSPPEPQPLLLQVDMWGKVYSGERTEDGVLMETIEAVSPDGVLSLLLPQGTRVLDRVGNPLDYIEVRPVIPPEPPHDKILIGPGYNIQPSCAFDPPIRFILHYDPEALSHGNSEEDLVTACYDQTQLMWIMIPTMVDTEADTITASLNHSSIFAILAVLPAPVGVPPFNADIYNLSIVPSQVRIWKFLPFAVRTGEEVTVTADVLNRGSLEGKYSVILKLNGHTRVSKEVALVPGQSKQVVFALSGIQPGHYTVTVNGYYGEFTSSLWINWWLIVGIIAALAVLSSLAAWLYKRRLKFKNARSQDSNLEY